MSRERVTRRLHQRRSVYETAAGGLVVDVTAHPPRGALIGRRGRAGAMAWSLPKGHVNPGETIEAAAVREVSEETGIIGRIVAELGTIEYWFVAGRRRVHKTVHHFLLIAEDGKLCDSDPEVDEVAWVPVADLAATLAYPGDRRLAARVPALLAGSA